MLSSRCVPRSVLWAPAGPQQRVGLTSAWEGVALCVGQAGGLPGNDCAMSSKPISQLESGCCLLLWCLGCVTQLLWASVSAEEQR